MVEQYLTWLNEHGFAVKIWKKKGLMAILHYS